MAELPLPGDYEHRPRYRRVSLGTSSEAELNPQITTETRYAQCPVIAIIFSPTKSWPYWKGLEESSPLCKSQHIEDLVETARRNTYRIGSISGWLSRKIWRVPLIPKFSSIVIIACRTPWIPQGRISLWMMLSKPWTIKRTTKYEEMSFSPLCCTLVRTPRDLGR